MNRKETDMEINLEKAEALPLLVRDKKPLIHCITNYVTATDLANVILSCGGSPIMADHPAEVKEMTRLSDCLLLNIGTPKQTTLEVMTEAGMEANRLGIPIILDPVGIGSTPFRTELILELLKKVTMTIIRGNTSEINTLCSELSKTTEKKPAHLPRGVDASDEDQMTEDNMSAFMETAVLLSVITKAVVVMTGATDIIADQENIYLVKNGCQEMSGITGSGCMLDGVLASYAATSNPVFESVTIATALYGLCGERATIKTKECQGGTGSFHRYFMDEINLSSQTEQKGGLKIELP
jgi:hydroxyethylthiazole kinase